MGVGWAPDDRCGSGLVTMNHDSTPHRIFKISELTRLIAAYLILIDPKGVVSLACTCRCLEEPALGTLWETQRSLCTPLRVLPEETWNCERQKGRDVVCNLGLIGETVT